MMDKTKGMLVCKLGDMESGLFLDGQIIGVIDPNEQGKHPELFKLSDEMQTIFYCVPIPLNKVKRFRGYRKSFSGSGKVECILRPDRLSESQRLNLRDKNAKKIVTELNESHFDFGKDLKSNPSIEDYNAFLGGSTSIGSGGVYALWEFLMADLGTMTSAPTMEQISDVVETSNPFSINDMGTFKSLFDGGGFTYNHSGSRHGIQFTHSGSGETEVKDFTWNRTSDGSTFSSCYIVNATNTGVFNVHHNKACGNFVGGGIRISGSTNVELRLSSNIVCDMNGIGILVSNFIKTSSVIEGNSVFNCTTGFDFSSQVLKARDNASFDNTTDYVNYASLSEYIKCASSDLTGTVGERSLISSTVFQSLINTDPNFLWPVNGEALYGSGVDPVISGHDTYFNGVSIVLGDVDIGANGLSRGGSLVPFQMLNYLNQMF